MTPQAYLRHRRVFETGFWLLLFVVNATANSITTNIDLARTGSGVETWEPWAWEITSGLTWLALIPLILAFDRRFPLHRPHPPRNYLWHLLFSGLVSVLHIAGMVLLRELAYATVGSDYDFGPWLAEFGYEYLKDVRTYATFLVLIYLYRLVLRRWQGEAGFLAEERQQAPPEAVTDRFLVKKLGREFLVRVEDIDWIESAANYVNLHVGDRVYPLRETMSAIEQKLAPRGFARVHRGAIVNLDRVREIEPFDTGDARAHLRTGHTVPVSRRYRQELRDRLG